MQQSLIAMGLADGLALTDISIQRSFTSLQGIDWHG
jgi:hypothetical protein